LSIFHYRGTKLKAWSLDNRMNSYTMIRVIRKDCMNMKSYF